MMAGTVARPTEGAALRYSLIELAGTLPDVISLGRGDPDLPTPAHIVAAAKLAARRGADGLAPVEGLPELRQAIAAKLNRENGLAIAAENVLVTTGGQEALFLLIQALLDPGDEILVPDPRYTSYDQAIEMAGGRMVLVPTREAEAFDLNPDEVEMRISPQTKALLLVTPSNPTAGIITPAHLHRIAEIAIEHDLVIISDEIYEKFVYDGWGHLSIGSVPGMADRTITLNGFSKTYAMTGWRVGYIAARTDFIRAVAKMKALVSLAAPSLSQWAALAALTSPQTCVEEFRAIYSERRAIVMHGLDEMGLRHSDPRGAFYVWINTGSTGMTGTELAYRLLEEARVLLFPGAGFGASWDGYLRLSLLQPAPRLAEALARMKPVLQPRKG